MTAIAYEFFADTAFQLTTTDGDTWILPQCVVGSPDPDDPEDLPRLNDFVEHGVVESVEKLGGRWFARWTMPGYLDCGDWHVFESEAEAREWVTQEREMNTVGDYDPN